jgi:hypothetical protein
MAEKPKDVFRNTGAASISIFLSLYTQPHIKKITSPNKNEIELNELVNRWNPEDLSIHHTTPPQFHHLSDPYTILEPNEIPYTTVLITPIRFKWMLIAWWCENLRFARRISFEMLSSFVSGLMPSRLSGKCFLSVAAFLEYRNRLLELWSYLDEFLVPSPLLFWAHR